MTVEKLMSLCLAVLLIVSCKPQPADDNTSNTSHVYRYGVLSGDVDSYDATIADNHVEFRLLGDLFETLAMDNPDGSLTPGAALSWSANADYTVWTFELNPNARWSNGDPVIAQDFIYAWRKAADPATYSPYSWYMEVTGIVNAADVVNGIKTPDALGVTALSDYRLQVSLDQSMSYFPKLTSFPLMAPLNEAAIDLNGDDWATPGKLVSNGAYKLTAASGSEIRLSKNTRYHGASDLYFDSIVVSIFSDEDEAADAFDADEIDETLAPFPLSDDEIAAYGNELLVFPRSCNYYYTFNMSKVELQNVNVRKALSYAIDREAIVRDITGTGQFEAYTFTPFYIDGFTAPTLAWADKTQVQRISDAQTLMAGEGYTSESPLALELYFNESVGHSNIASAMKASWEENLPVTVTVRSDLWQTFLTNRGNGDFQLARGAWCGDYNEPSTFLHLLRSTSSYNDGQFNNSTFDNLIASAAETEDNVSLYTQAEQVLSEQMPIIPVYFYAGRLLLKEDIQNYGINNIQQRIYVKDLSRQ